MPVAIVLLANADGSPSEVLPAYLKEFDPDAYNGRGRTAVAYDPREALLFPDMAAAAACWKRQSTVQPLRDDGRPNRPMTAYTAMFEEVRPL